MARLFREFGAGKSPEAITKDLNREGVPGPGGRPWSNTTLRGQARRGTGVLHNALYRGVLEWNRCSYVKDPRTGRRVARPNPPHLWETIPVPELRIVTDELWLTAKERQAEVRARVGGQPGSDAALNATHRARFLLSGLLLRRRLHGGGQGIATAARRAARRGAATTAARDAGGGSRRHDRAEAMDVIRSMIKKG
ncbi:recombinase family protein [Alsobacter sp. KACC 23698]|uniref:recombinase family protein n=1 Tax=Alsobacter sp. KACC 23698 TaxID=3149229 RepID=UPI003877CA3F